MAVCCRTNADTVAGPKELHSVAVPEHGGTGINCAIKACMYCPHCAAPDVIDSDRLGDAVRLCRRCGRVWAIAPSEVRPEAASSPPPVPTTLTARIAHGLRRWWRRRAAERAAYDFCSRLQNKR